MTLEEAFRILDLSPDCSEAELKERYRALSRQFHPDTPGGDETKQALINEANDLITEAFLRRTALVPYIERAIKGFESAIATERAARQTKEYVELAQRRDVRPLQSGKYFAIVLAAAAATFGWFSDDISTMVIPPVWLLFFKFASKLFGALAAALQFVVWLYKQRVEVAARRLDNIEYCAARLASALHYEDRSQIGIRDIDVYDPALYYSRNLDRMLRIVGIDVIANLISKRKLNPFDERQILLLKSIEHGLLHEVVPREIEPGITKKFELKFKPSKFMHREYWR